MDHHVRITAHDITDLNQWLGGRYESDHSALHLGRRLTITSHTDGGITVTTHPYGQDGEALDRAADAARITYLTITHPDTAAYDPWEHLSHHAQNKWRDVVQAAIEATGQ